MLTEILTLLPIVLACVAGFNVMMSGLGQILHTVKATNAENAVGKISGFLAKVTDVLQANVQH